MWITPVCPNCMSTGRHWCEGKPRPDPRAGSAREMATEMQRAAMVNSTRALIEQGRIMIGVDLGYKDSTVVVHDSLPGGVDWVSVTYDQGKPEEPPEPTWAEQDEPCRHCRSELGHIPHCPGLQEPDEGDS